MTNEDFYQPLPSLSLNYEGIKMVRKVWKETGCSLMTAKAVLERAGWDYDKAILDAKSLMADYRSLTK